MKAESAGPGARSEGVVHVATRGGPFKGASASTIRKRAQQMLDHLALGSVELSVALVSDKEIHELNRAYRGKDKPTDVLAFPMLDDPSSISPGELLGDVIISVDTARRQASKRRRPLLDELTMLLAHGLLHLIGYDHQNDEQEREMKARTRDLERVVATSRAGARTA